MKIDLDKIIIGDRHRKDFGDLKSLADSISELGLLQPIGVTEGMNLIFGERRLRACRDHLGWSEIDVRVIDMPHIVVGENAENEVRKDFTPSERVAIARAIADEMSARKGHNQHTPEEQVQKFAQATEGQKTSDFAAKRAGFGNRETFRQAEAVVEQAEPELVEAMDKGKVSIFSAYKAAKQEPEVQREIAKTGRTMRDLEDDRATHAKKRIEGQHPLVKIQIITDAVGDIANCELSPEDFKSLAPHVAKQRFHRNSLAALAFLKGVMEVENDQERTA